MSEKTELQEIREAFGASRAQFAKVFLGISKQMMYCYETRRNKIPDKIIRIARVWKSYLDTMNGSKDEKVQD